MVWHLVQIISLRHAVHFLRTKLKMFLLLHLQLDFSLEIWSTVGSDVAVGGGSMGGGGDSVGGGGDSMGIGSGVGAAMTCLSR